MPVWLASDNKTMHETAPKPEAAIPLPQLLPGEQLIKAEDIPEYIPTEPPSRLREMQRLAQVKAEGEVGAFGPSLASLSLERPGGFISPELRKYEALFGRDSLRVALDLLPIYPLLAHATIHSLASRQGMVTNAARDEEPGKIIHEDRPLEDPIAREITEEYGWQWPYYGSVDSTPQFMHLIYKYTKQVRGGESLLREQINGINEKRTIGDAYKQALMWVENRLNKNSEGLLEFRASIPKGIENQVWRDSWDAYFHADGTLANHDNGIASVEAQQLTFDAITEAAELFEQEFGDAEKANSLRARADTLRTNILKYFWVDEKGGYFALGTDRDQDGNLRQLKVRTSDMGHLLRSRLLAGEQYKPQREAVISHLFSPEMLNISGIRTLASDEVRFRPGAYHNGSVWLWDTYYIAEGLRRHGYYGLATHLADKIHMVINVTQKFPEYVRGDDFPMPRLNPRVVDIWDERNNRINRVEQPPQEVQAWSVAADIARDYYSGRVPESAVDPDAIEVEDLILSQLPTH